MTPTPLVVGTTNEHNRAEWVRKTLESLSPGLRILDAGAGQQQYRKYCGHLRYVCQDFAQYDHKNGVGLQHKNWDYGKLDLVCDITAIPEPDASFDAILCTEVFEHIPDPIAAIREFSRLLPKGGQLILTSPFWSLTHFAPYHFASGFSTYWYKKHLADHGFDITELTPNGNYFECVAQEIRRISDIVSRYAGELPTQEEKNAMKMVLGYLQEKSAEDRGSTELLAWGWHVRAVRQ